jgi:hypothetical protein
MVSQAHMETFVGLVLLSVVLLLRDGQMTSGRRPKLSTTNSWLADLGGSEKCQNEHKLSDIDKTDCQIRPDQVVCQASFLQVDDQNAPWPIPIAYPCEGPAYDKLEAQLRNYRQSKVEDHAETWGRRAFGIPAHRNVLFLGNIHTQQMAMSLACQQDGNIASITVLDERTQTIQIDFDNNSTMVMLNDEQLIIDDDWKEILTADMGGIWKLNDFDALVLGLFNDCQIMLKSHAHECGSITFIMLRQLLDAFIQGPVLFISEMAATRVDESNEARDLIRYYRDTLKRKNVWFINGRRYISKIAVEGAAPYLSHEEAVQVVWENQSGEPSTNWTIQDALNEGVESRALPRCQGEYGGHADLLSWDITEFLFNQLVW